MRPGKSTRWKCRFGLAALLVPADGILKFLRADLALLESDSPTAGGKWKIWLAGPEEGIR
jgi:hypothetical protein